VANLITRVLEQLRVQVQKRGGDVCDRTQNALPPLTSLMSSGFRKKAIALSRPLSSSHYVAAAATATTADDAAIPAATSFKNATAIATANCELTTPRGSLFVFGFTFTYWGWGFYLFAFLGVHWLRERGAGRQGDAEAKKVKVKK